MAGELFPEAVAPAPGLAEEDAGERRVPVLLPWPLKGVLDYRVPPGVPTPPPGTVLVVPLSGRPTPAVVWDRDAKEAEATARNVPFQRLKPIGPSYDVPPLPEVMRRFVDWVAAYTMTLPGLVLRLALHGPSLERSEPARPRFGWALARSWPEARSEARPDDLRLTPARQAVLAVLAVPASVAPTTAELAELAHVSPGVVRGLADAGVLLPVPLLPEEAPPLDWARPGPILSEAQAMAATALVDAVKAEAAGVILLDGVTGSGKTEVYSEAIAAALAAGGQALVLLPEIALTASVLDRFAQRFGTEPWLWHSGISSQRRRRVWRAVAAGAPALVIGARSALFLPFPNLRLIVIDEEHEAAFKQEDGVLYHARDMAVVRGRLGACPVVLASATPSLETVANVEAGRFRRLVLPARHGGARLPEVALIDLRCDLPPRGRFLAPGLVQSVAETLERGEQALLFLNRRGYAPLTLCRACGHRLECPHCTAWLVEHRHARVLACHHCGHREAPPTLCPACGASESLAACGPGVERIAEEAAQLFPEARLATLASDLIEGPAAIADALEAIRTHAVDLVIGTQIVAKGHHFPDLTLVGVVDADLGLAGGDLRAAERTFQLMLQVGGRAGRGERPGRVLIQTYAPEHRVMQALVSGERDRFYAAETEERRLAGMPPYGRLAALILSAEAPETVDQVAAALGRAWPREAAARAGIEVLGPAPAPLALLRGRHRRRFLVRGPREQRLQPFIAAWLGAVTVPAAVKIAIDIDPQSFL